MSEAAVTVHIVNALVAAVIAAADREADAKTALVSVAIDMLGRSDAGAVDVALTRKTRTLIFLHADFKSEAGALIASASSVHKLSE